MIGETAEVGDDVTIYQGVTLGGTGFARGKRHPTVGNEVMIGAGAALLGPIEIGDRAKIGANSVVIHDVPPNSTVVGNPGHPVRVDGKKPEGPDADWVHLPDPVADAISGLANRLTELEELVAEETGRKPGRRSPPPEAPGAARTRPAAEVSSRPSASGAAARLVPRCLTSVPQRGVEHARRHPEPLGDELARVHRAAADLALLLAGREQLPGINAGGERGVVPEHAIDAQHVRHQVVREDRQAIEV